MNQEIIQAPNEILSDRNTRFTLLCKSPIALSSDSSVKELGNTVEQGDLVVRLTIGSSARFVMHDGCGVHEIREHAIPLNDRLVHAAVGEVQQVSTTAFIAAGFPREWIIVAFARGCGSLARGTTEMLESAMLTVHSMGVAKAKQREDWREDMQERIYRDPRQNLCDPLDTISRKAAIKESVEDRTMGRERMDSARARVTERAWLAVRLDGVGYTLQEIANWIGASPDATRKLLYRTRVEIQKPPPD